MTQNNTPKQPCNVKLWRPQSAAKVDPHKPPKNHKKSVPMPLITAANISYSSIHTCSVSFFWSVYDGLLLAWSQERTIPHHIARVPNEGFKGYSSQDCYYSRLLIIILLHTLDHCVDHGNGICYWH